MNKVVLSGRLTKDVEFRATPDGITISNFTFLIVQNNILSYQS